MSAKLKADLEQVKTAFENFRAGRTGKERLPENLWAAAVALLDHYPFNQVWRELRVKPEYLKRRAGLAKDKSGSWQEQPPIFLALTTGELAAIKDDANKKITAQSANQASECRLVIERVDGSRLTVNLPIDWLRIESLCTNFGRG